MIRIAVVSDLHAAQRPTVDSASQETFLYIAAPELPRSQDPAHSLRDLIDKENLRVDALLVAGDLANRAEPEGLVWASMVTERLATSLQAECVMTVGNHDLKSHDQRVGDKFAAARSVRAFFPGKSQEEERSFWSDHYYIRDFATWRAIVLNTAFDHTVEANTKRGMVASATLEKLQGELDRREKKQFQLALMHHHPLLHSDTNMTHADVIPNGDAVLEAFSRMGVAFVVHGHKHHPRITQTISDGATITVFAAGSFSAGLPPSLGSSVRNVFHIITVEPAKDHGHAARGTIATWEYGYSVGWRPTSQTSSGLPHLTGFGSNEDAETLTARIVDGLPLGGERWSETLARVPEIKFLIPAAQFRLLASLKDQHITVFLDQTTNSPAMVSRVPS